ncbi:MAG: Ig-like domain-containing protein, partial [Bacillota bacterium]|nr:Ig-like domain-containing protein [Bacillota bacterium]
MVIRNDDYNEEEYDKENEGYVDSSVPSEDDIPDSQDNNSNKEFDDYSNDSGSYDNNFEDSYEESSSSGNGGILDSIINFIKNNKLLVIALVLVIVLLIGLSACSGGKKTSQTTGFTIENPQITLQVGSSQKIVTKTTGGSGNWAFESENISIATVDNQGNVTGKGVGNTTVIVKYLTANQMVYTKPCFVIVSNGDSSVELTDAKFQDGSIEMPLNYEYTLLKEFTPENGYVSSIKFESSDPTVGTVDDNGTVKSLKEGTTDVTMRVNDKFTDTISIKVNKNLSQVVIGRPITALQFAEAEYKVQVGKTIELPLDTNPMQADLSGIEWFTDNSNVATVSGGVVAGISEGEAIITAKYGEIS